MEDGDQVVKKFMYMNRKAPYGTIYALESLEVVLIAAAFDQDVSLVFADDGVYQLMKGQETDEIGMKNFSPTYSALGDYDIKKIYIEKESLEELRVDDMDDVEDKKYDAGVVASECPGCGKLWNLNAFRYSASPFECPICETEFTIAK